MCSLGQSSKETAYLCPTWCQPGLTGAGGSRYLTPMSGSGAGCRMQSFGVPTTNASPLQQDSLGFLPYTVAQKLPPSKVCNSHSTASATFCPTRPAQTSRGGERCYPLDG